MKVCNKNFRIPGIEIFLGRGKVADFGMSKIQTGTMSTTIGTFQWSPPEVLLGNRVLNFPRIFTEIS